MKLSSHGLRWAGLSALSLLLLGPPTGICSSAWTPGQFPNPQTEPRRCGRGAVASGRSWVCDPDLLLPEKEANVIEGTLKSIAAAEEPYAEARTDCGSGRRTNKGHQVLRQQTSSCCIEQLALATTAFAAINTLQRGVHIPLVATQRQYFAASCSFLASFQMACMRA